MPRRSAAVLVGAVATAAALLASCSSGSSGAPTASAFLSAWSKGDLQGAAGHTGAPDRAVADLQQVTNDLQVGHADLRLGDVGGSSATFSAALTLAGLGVWKYQGRLGLRQTAGGQWVVAWAPSDIYPGLGPGQRLGRTRTLPARAPILDRTGAPLVLPTPVVTVGVVPGKLTNPAAAIAALQATTGTDPARVQQLLAGAKPDQFIPVITLRQADYARAKPVLYPIPGLSFQQKTENLPPTSTFGRAVLGQIGQATADALKQAGPGFEAADDVGLSGLELTYQRQLAGTPSGSVVVLDAQGQAVRTAFSVTGQPGHAVQTTLDQRLQTAAETALATTPHPAALVAVQPSTGQLLAVANTPPDSSFDRALSGQYPPGSSFKIVTTTALIPTGVTPDTPAACPPSVTVGGRSFTNFEGETSGTVPFSVDFARSCNTAFIGLASRLNADQLQTAGRSLGIGTGWKLPLPAFTGQIPTTSDPTELAADAIGQGRVLASPVAMALAAGAIDAGQWRTPVLVTDPANASTPPAQPPPSLPPGAARTLAQLMRGVVTGGTGTAANVPGPPVFGKTGTAEFGSGQPPQTHAWFIGYRGDVSFAVIVEGGGVGGAVAAPIAAGFLQATG
ncbi:MAG TPA: penicillin-binding transpeptidase domain-containing protein [Acidimicrobiales bacterium]|nr:penicillin-binding transpeptidase domain-containing protein [Acidimicrobiales bacterium]